MGYLTTSGACKTAMAHTIASPTTPLAHVEPWTARRRTETHPQIVKRGRVRLPDQCADWGRAALHESCSLFAGATDARTRRVCSGNPVSTGSWMTGTCETSASWANPPACSSDDWPDSPEAGSATLRFVQLLSKPVVPSTGPIPVRRTRICAHGEPGDGSVRRERERRAPRGRSW